jgi:hypothetical protein
MPRPAGRLATREYLMTWLRPPILDLDDDLREAREWAAGYSPVGREENSGLILEYAKGQHASLMTTIGELDKKADDLTRMILTVFGAVLAVASTRLVQVSWPASIPASIGLFAQATGLVIAALARVPAKLETPMEPRRLMKVSDLPLLPTKGQMESVAAATYHVAIVGATLLNEWKSTQLRRANVLFLSGLGLLVLSLSINYLVSPQPRKGAEMKFELRTGSMIPGDPLSASPGRLGPATNRTDRSARRI